ncbi:MAG: hypothetical protein ACKV0T_16955, partial [Planctomycetales bacterium]
MPHRTKLTISTALILVGAFALYCGLVSPFVSPGKEELGDQSMSASEPKIRSHENSRQAAQHLPDQAWTADAKYQARTGDTYVFAEEWEKVEESGRVRFTPFAMIWRPKDQKGDQPPLTIVCESALVEFAEAFDVSHPKPGRVVGGALEGRVTVRGQDGMQINGRDFYFSEADLRVWSDNPVKFAQGPHSGEGLGLEMLLIPDKGPIEEDKPAISGVRTIRLRKDVVMNLVSQDKEGGGSRETVRVTSVGRFEYGVEDHAASFMTNVHVVRPTGPKESDELRCDLLTLIFETERGPGVESSESAVPEGGDEGFNVGGGNLRFRRLRAEGPTTTVVSQRAGMHARMQELTYDAQSRIIVLKDARQVRMWQRQNELLCGEVTAILDAEGQIAQATCRGAGRLLRYREGDLEAAAGKQRPVEFTCEWQRELRMEPDPKNQLDLIEISGRAVMSQADKMALQGDVVRLWVTPDESGKRQFGKQVASEGTEERVRPRRLLALGNVAFASPQITGETKRLEVWFEEGALPLPPGGESIDRRNDGGPAPPRGTGAKSPAATPVAVVQSRRSKTGDLSKGRGLANVAPPSSSKSKNKDAGRANEPPPNRKQPPAERRRDLTDKPAHVIADLIRVRAMNDQERTEIAQVITEGHVQVKQERGAEEAPFDLKGDRMHLWNYSESHQVIRVEGQPAHVRDRGLHLEGADIHFDRGENVARVEGAGVLRLPMRKGLDGKPLDKPQTLDILWTERMKFDGQTADFFAGVSTRLNGSAMDCEEMHVTLTRRISFSQDTDHAADPEVQL